MENLSQARDTDGCSNSGSEKKYENTLWFGSSLSKLQYCVGIFTDRTVTKMTAR